MQAVKNQDHSYTIGNITFIVTPIYRDKKGETIPELLLKLMKAEIERKE